ncbi:hypothetical protein GPECTOR_127g525 [Gonium pectorale]|uniref:FATC domain-containing protein n=1 Tax=Gonium pectorale TaxID=33097 RepID=A0A150FYJ0_GONPE|nr:hypothetical protein GPECTOR_127g525 [Gonium pectorale]|eukprot:KXZ42647.1 hypothetical protein GPECTOR_127g525 [Gonium pectorale]
MRDLGNPGRVFLREPVADWQHEAVVLRGLQVAARQPAARGGSGGASAEAAEPEGDDGAALAEALARSRVSTALSKLARRHPSLVLLEELAPRHGAAAHFPALADAVRGTAPGHPTARAALLAAGGGGRRLSPSEQARCLLDLATDPNLLGRMYVGWRPYL